MVGVSASVNLPLHHKVQKFSSGTGSPGWSRKNGCKTVVVWCGGCASFGSPESTTKTANRSFSHFRTAHGRKSVYFTMGLPFTHNCPFWWRDLDPHLTHGSLGPCEPTTQMASGSIQLFLHRWLQSVPILYNGTLLPLKIVPFHVGSGSPSDTWFPGLTQVLNPNGISIGLAIFNRWPKSIPIHYSGLPFPPSKLPLPMKDVDLPYNAWFLGPT